LVKDLEEALSLVKWPFTEAAGSGAAAEAALQDDEHMPRVEQAFSLASKLHPPPHSTVVAQERSLPVRVMLKPLIKRFKFHFSGSKETNNKEKPEWFFTQVS
jgi:hypothetical protein